jgi:hypothetical protein
MMDLTVKSLLQQTPVFGDGWKEPGGDLGRIAATEHAHRPDRSGDSRHIAMVAELADEAAVRLERPRHARDHELGPAHPVKHQSCSSS